MPATNDELIVYTNSRNGLGIRIIGAKKPIKQSGIFIKQLLEDGLAQRDGRLKVSDQIISINDESSVGITREHAVDLLRSAAATNQVRLLIRHGNQSEYLKLLYDEKSTDDETYHRYYQQQQRHHYHHYRNNRNKHISEEQQTPRGTRRHHQQNHNSKHLVDQDSELEPTNLSENALNFLLNSSFKINDLIDLLKKSYDIDRHQEKDLLSHFSSLMMLDDRISLRDFERQASVILNENINLLQPFYSSSNNSTSTSLVQDFRFQISQCPQTIQDLQQKILTCEQTQRLSQEIELEYEDLLKYLYDQIKQYKLSEIKYDKKLQIQNSFIQKLFSYIPQNCQDMPQLKYEYQQVILQRSSVKPLSTTTTTTTPTTSPILQKQRYSQYYPGRGTEKI
ncbi:unnamed protein product [Didymodactylos carnosus]|uniref:PDZ domain-containing protein n=1 Tax=Didymodactylos carnosus TaxID=1234261 RepID=A0A813XCJ1_9BILA|nr:unnamed protein product [Didymodactylos carnosus]CAF3655449.1 unnamed protein product [Didymodactylos carnosus]